MKKSNRTTVIALGGSLIAPPKGIDVLFLKRLRGVVIDHISQGHRVILVCGGGQTCRTYQQAAMKLTKAKAVDKDWIGIMATRLNAELVRVLFKDVAYHRVVYNPHEPVKTDKKVIIGAGHEPGCTTDYDTAVLAMHYKAHMIINTTNVDYIYDKDPNKFADAKKILNLTWKEYFRMIGHQFKPGMHVPFDPVASEVAMKHKMKVVSVKGSNLPNLRKVLAGGKFKGSVIG
ncbi:UMP kinase [Candidatus Woesearchaeota archaeon]|nr:UMP kinase [Candidatus Woesearchaeota archaeon]